MLVDTPVGGSPLLDGGGFLSLPDVGWATAIRQTLGDLWQTLAIATVLIAIIFNPGFNASHIMSLIPGMIEEVEIFKEELQKHAKNGNLMYLEKASLDLTIDTIGRVVMWVIPKRTGSL